MKVIKPFFLGMLGGLALGLALLVGLYFSPLRQDLYFAADAELADVRTKLDQYQEWLAQTDLRLAQAQADPAAAVSDSLRNAQTKAWRDYKAWRNRLGELARAHDKPTAEGFWPWTISLALWILPIAALLALAPGIFFAFRARSRFNPAKVRSPKVRTAKANAPPTSARAQALAHFEDAIKKVARISEHERGPAAVPSMGDSAVRQGTGTVVEYPVNKVPESAPAPVVDPPRNPNPAPHAFQTPSAVPPLASEARDAGRETAFFQVGAPWGDPAGDRIGNPAPSGAPPAAPSGKKPPGLSMEDEDGPLSAFGDGDPDDEETLGVMPPTTEVERVERRKEEVLKLARKGMTSSEISRRMRISQDQVDFIIRLRREKG